MGRDMSLKAVIARYMFLADWPVKCDGGHTTNIANCAFSPAFGARAGRAGRRDTAGEMSRENVEIAHEMAAALGRRDLERFLEISDPEVEWHSSISAISEGGAYHGHEGKFRQGKVVYLRAFRDPEFALGAVGLSE